MPYSRPNLPSLAPCKLASLLRASASPYRPSGRGWPFQDQRSARQGSRSEELRPGSESSAQCNTERRARSGEGLTVSGLDVHMNQASRVDRAQPHTDLIVELPSQRVVVQSAGVRRCSCLGQGRHAARFRWPRCQQSSPCSGILEILQEEEDAEDSLSEKLKQQHQQQQKIQEQLKEHLQERMRQQQQIVTMVSTGLTALAKSRSAEDKKRKKQQ